MYFMVKMFIPQIVILEALDVEAMIYSNAKGIKIIS